MNFSDRTLESCRRQALRRLLFVRSINELGAFTLSFLAVLAGPHRAGALLSVFGVFAIVSRLLGARLLTSLRPKVVIAIGLVGTGSALIALLEVHSFAATLVAAALLGLAFEIYEPATQEAIARLADGPKRHDIYVLLGTCLTITAVIAGAIAGMVLPFGVRWLLWADVVTCFAAAAVALWPLDWRAALGETLTPKPAQQQALLNRGLPKPLVMLTVSHTLFAIGYLSVSLYLPLGLIEEGAGHWLPGLLLAAGAGLAMLTRRWSFPAMAKLSLPQSVQLSCLASGLLVLTMAALPLEGFAVTYLLWSAVQTSLMGSWSSLVADMAPAEDRPKWFAIHGSAWGIAQALAPWAVQVLFETGVGVLAASLTVSCVGMVGATFVLVVLAERPAARTCFPSSAEPPDQN